MFDTYEGLTKPGVYDYTTKNSTLPKMYCLNNEEVIATWEATKVSSVTHDWCYCSLEDVKKNVSSIYDYIYNDFVLNNYNPHSHIKAEVSI